VVNEAEMEGFEITHLPGANPKRRRAKTDDDEQAAADKTSSQRKANQEDAGLQKRGKTDKKAKSRK